MDSQDSSRGTEQQQDRKRSEDARRGRTLARVAGSSSVLFAFAIVAMANYLAARHYQRFDWTGQGLFTLSDKSEKVLAGLDTDVELYLFMSMGEPSFGEIKELLERYRARSQHMQIHYVDPDRQPSEFRILAQRFGLTGATMDTGEVVAEVAAVATSGDRTWSIKREDFSQADFDAFEAGKAQLDMRAEQALTGAIVQVTSGRATRICVTKGHGEWSLGSHGERSLEGVEQALRHDNVELHAIETLGKSSLPDDCDAIFVLGPQRTFAEEEVALLEGYVRQGGNLLLALDPVIERDVVRPTGFEAFAEKLGIHIDPSLVVELDAQRLLSSNPVEFRVMSFDARHETTRLLSAWGGSVFMRMARSVRVEEDSDAQALLLSSPESFAETDIAQLTSDARAQPDNRELSGPLPLAVALRVAADTSAEPSAETSADRAPGGRLVVVGDSEWLAGGFLEAPILTNRELLSAWTGWLTERDALISIPPKQASLGYINFDQDALSGVFFRVVVLIPLAALLLGVAVWWSRRS